MRGTKYISTPLAMLPGLVILGFVTAMGGSTVAAQDRKKEAEPAPAAKPKGKNDGKKKESAKAKKEAEEKAAKKLADLIKKLGAEKTADREKAELELKELGDKAIKSLKKAYWGRDRDLRQTIDDMIKALGSDDWNIRRRATLVLADIGIPALGALAKAQKSGDIEVQYRTRILVRRIQQNNDKELVHQARTREAITRLLGNRGGEDALGILGDALSHGDRGTRRVAAKSLANIGDFVEKRLPLLSKALADQDLWVSAYGAHGLGKLGTPKAEKVLIESLKTIRRPVPPKPKVDPKKKKVKPKKVKKKKKKPFDPFSTDPKDLIKTKNGYPIGAMPPVTSYSGGKNISAHGFRRSRVVRSLGIFARAGSTTAGDAILGCFADEVWLVRLEALNILTPILKKAGATESDLRFPGTKKEGQKLVKKWTGKIAGAISGGSAEVSKEAPVVTTDDELKKFLSTLQDKDGKLLGKQAFAKMVESNPLKASLSLGKIKKLIKDVKVLTKVKSALTEVLTQHQISLRQGKDRKTFIVRLDQDGSLIIATNKGFEHLDPNNILRILWEKKEESEEKAKGKKEEKDEEKDEAKDEEKVEIDQVLLSSGERLTGQLEKLEKGSAYLRWTSGEQIVIPASMISAISLKSRLSSMAGDRRSGPGEIVTRNGSRLIGKVLGVSGKTVSFDLDGQSLPLKRAEIVELRFNSKASGEQMNELGHFARVHLKGGDRLWGLLLALESDRIQLGSQTLGRVWVDRARLSDIQFSSSLGFDSDVTVIANYSGNSIRYVDLKGKVLKDISIPESPWDIERLQHGHLLVALYRRGSVIELDENGKEIWRVSGFSQPSDVDRLPNGHTLICDRGRGKIIEVDHNRNVVFQYSGIYASEVERLANGHTLMADSNRGRLIEIDAFGNVVWELAGYRNPQDIDVLENGHILLVEGHNRVIEIDRSGRIFWEKKGLRSPLDADRLENGNTLITESSGNKVIEVAPDGSIVRTIGGLNYPSQAQRR